MLVFANTKDKMVYNVSIYQLISLFFPYASILQRGRLAIGPLLNYGK